MHQNEKYTSEKHWDIWKKLIAIFHMCTYLQQCFPVLANQELPFFSTPEFRKVHGRIQVRPKHLDFSKHKGTRENLSNWVHLLPFHLGFTAELSILDRGYIVRIKWQSTHTQELCQLEQAIHSIWVWIFSSADTLSLGISYACWSPWVQTLAPLLIQLLACGTLRRSR